ncbi:hypothetical protein XHC_1975 [Xanthomonas hortorum pv. carotae str. M081]|nr:hypothetical protein XHC_1975 [Xanthomonas hortorum pv. carotae str. M081]
MHGGSIDDPTKRRAGESRQQPGGEGRCTLLEATWLPLLRLRLYVFVSDPSH